MMLMNNLPSGEARRVRWLAWGGTAALVLLPLLAMKALEPNAWALADLPFALVMVAAVGIAFEAALRLPQRWTRRAGAAAAVGTGLLLLWGNLAVGFAGSEDNAANALVVAVPLVALLGSLLARFRDAGVALALAAASLAQVAVGVVLLSQGFFTGPLTVSFAGLWLAAALLFRRAAMAPPAAGTRNGPASVGGSRAAS
jgi:hypothetical protein